MTLSHDAIEDAAWANFAARQIRDAYEELRVATEKCAEIMRKNGALDRNETVVVMNVTNEMYASLTERAQALVEQ